MSKENLVAIIFALVILFLVILSALAHPSNVPLLAILGIYLTGLIIVVIRRWREKAHKKDHTKGTIHGGRGLLIIFMLIVGTAFGYLSAQKSEGLAILKPQFSLLIGAALLIFYFGGNWLRSRSNFFHRFFDRPLITNSISFYSLMLFGLSAIYGILAGATLFGGFGV